MNESSLLSRRLVPLTAAGGVVLLVVAGVVLAGWYTHTPSLAELGMSPQPMPYNGAVGFVLAGLALLALAAGRAGWARLPAALMIALGLATLAEYLFNLDLGLDQALMTDFIGVNPVPGRMA